METKIDWKALENDQFSVKDTIERQYHDWRERTIRESLAKIVAENPDLAQCVMYEYSEGLTHKITFGGTDESGMCKLPDGVRDCYIIDLVKYKRMMADGTIQPSQESEQP